MQTNRCTSVTRQNVVIVGIKLALILVAFAVSGEAHDRDETGVKYSADTRPIEPANEFAKLNPGYKQRVGLFYEKEYLPPASEQLAERLKLEPQQKQIATEILRCFIYDFLTAKVRDNGRITLEHLKATIAAMDAKFTNELPKGQFEVYTQWRNDNGGGNAIAFLTADVHIER